LDIYSKFDLHIHSFASSLTKSGDKTIVANSKIDNLPILITQLITNNINVVSITDHNIFDKEIYEKLKEQEKIKNCIAKVLPGIEFDLVIDKKNVHVICIFDDTNPEHATKIKDGFDQKNEYTVDDLGSVLRKIELSVVLIAHQKCDYKSENPQKTSLSYAGQEIFYKFIGCEFFDALEIQNSKVEGILKNRFVEDFIKDINFLIGSDCHEWSGYPAHHIGAKPATLLYMKSLPTFQGLVMAVTDYSRIFMSPEPKKENVLSKIEILCNEESLSINLSDKINVIIGDNSVGKSTLIKCLTGDVEKVAIDFLKSHKIEVITSPIDKNLFSYSGQGKIREMFEETEEKLPIRQKFKGNFKFIDKIKYYKIINNIFDYYKKIWENNEKIKENEQIIKKLLVVPNFTVNEKHYLSIDLNLKPLDNDYTELNKIFEEILDPFKKLRNFNHIINEDIETLREIYSKLSNINKKYLKLHKNIEIQNKIIGAFKYVATTFNQNLLKISNSDELSYNAFVNEYKKAIASICNDVEYKNIKIDNVWDTFQNFKIEPSINAYDKYCFIDKPSFNNDITREFVDNFISNQIIIDKKLEELTTTEILTSIKGKKIHDKSAENINEFMSILFEKFKDSYFNTTVEIKRGDDKLTESNSAGINALYYLDILSYTFNKSIFIIDQPEDDVSQSRISSDLISSLKNLSKTSQIILVTHNPQLVVNLDADNIIILKKDEKIIKFYSGPLEYKTNDFTILDLVANTLDGGTDVIKKRWKRYDKTSI